ncbi:hypothetical protein D3C71_1761080 [compost metagenome]
MASMASSAALGSAGGLVNAEGSVGGGGPKSSSGAASAVAKVRNIAQCRLDLRSKPKESQDGVVHFIFHPTRDVPSSPNPGRQLLRVPGGVQLMSHYCRAKKKFNLINNLFLKCFKPEKGEWGIFLKFGGKRLFGWV